MRLPIEFCRRDLLLIYLILSYLSVFGIWSNIVYAQVPTVSVNPSSNTANPGESFTVDIIVNEDFTDVLSWAIKIRWERDLLECTSVTEGPFLSGQPEGTTFVKKIYDSYIDIGCTTNGYGYPGVDGPGILMTVTFNVTDTGETTLDMYDSEFLDSNIFPITHNVEHGNFYTTMPVVSFTYMPKSYGRPIVGENVTFDASASYDPDGGIIDSYEWDFGDSFTGTGMVVTHTYDAPGDYDVALNVTDDDSETYNITDLIEIKLHDIAILNVTVEPQKVPVNETTIIYVTVMNNGSHKDMFNVTAYYYDSITVPASPRYCFIATFNKTIELMPGEEKILGKSPAFPGTNLVWNTTGAAEGLYPIWAYAFLVDNVPPYEFRPGEEENTINNARFGGPVNVTISEEHDIAITGVAVSPTDVNVGQTVKVDVRVKNEGNVVETFSVEVYNDTFLIGTKTTTLYAETEKTLHFSWFQAANTTAVQSTFNVSAHVPPIINPPPGTNETDTDDNTFANVTGTIRLLPEAYFTFSPSEPILNQTVTFDASASYAPGIPPKTIVSYSWDFGDGASDTEATVTHAYDASGSYSVALTVVDSDGLSDTYGKSVTVQKLNSTITVSASVMIVPVGSEGTVISGSISPVRVAANVSIYYAESEENKTWISLANVNTDDNGQYSYVWTLWLKPGTYEVKASWSGDDVTLPAGSPAITVDLVQKVTSTVDFSVSSTTIMLGGSIDINGSISPVRAGMNVSIWHMPEGSDWSELATVTTGEDGKYFYSWEPANSGTHILKASWLGDEVTEADESDVQAIVVEEAPALNIFLYSTVGLAVVLVVTVVYFLWVKKPTPVK